MGDAMAGVERDNPAVVPELVARVWAALGDSERAFAWLERGVSAHSAGAPWIRIFPEFGSLRSDPRYGELLRRMGIA